MNLNKTRRYTILGLIFTVAALIVANVMSYLLTPILETFFNSYSNDMSTLDELFQVLSDFGIKYTSVLSFIFVLNVPRIIFHVLTMVDAVKFKMKKTVFILLIIGIFESIVAIIGFIIALREIHRLEQTPPPFPNDDDEDSNLSQ